MRIRKIWVNSEKKYKLKYGKKYITEQDFVKLVREGKIWYAYCMSNKKNTHLQKPIKVEICESEDNGINRMYILVLNNKKNTTYQEYVRPQSHSLNMIFADSEESCTKIFNALIKHKIRIKDSNIHAFQQRQRSVINSLINEIKV